MLSLRPYHNARYAKLRGQVGKRDLRIQNKIGVDSFMASRSIGVDFCKVISECIRLQCIVYKFWRNSVVGDKWQELCRTDFIQTRIVDFPNATESHIELIEQYAFVRNNVFGASNIATPKILALLTFVISRKTKQLPFFRRRMRRVDTLCLQNNCLPQGGHLHDRSLS